MALTHQAEAGAGTGFAAEARAVWQQMPHKGVLLGLLAAWMALFHFMGNSTLGYVNTRSAFGWWFWVMTRGLDGGNFLRLLDQEEAHAWFIPWVVLGLLWWKRDAWLAIPKRIWWPALGLLVLSLLVHFLGYMVQQTRISLVAFFLGLYALTGLVWGRDWLRLAFFPFCLFAFCVPLGNAAEFITFPLRMLATKVAVGTAHVVLGIDVIQSGSSILDPQGRYQYEVAAACSGIRSLTAILALSVIYGYAVCHNNWRRLVMALTAFPLAVAGNVLRLLVIIMAAEAFGQSAGSYVHTSALFSLLPYVPGIAGLLLLGHWLRDQPASRPPPAATPEPQAQHAV